MSQLGKIRVGILYGGQSAEHEISILSARNVLAALDRSRYTPVLIGIDKSGRWLAQEPERLLNSEQDARKAHLEPGPPRHLLGAVQSGSVQSEGGGAPLIDVAFPVLHGTLGEDGAIQGLLEVAGIPYVGAGVLGSAIGMDKDVMKRLLRDAGIAVADFLTVHRERYDAAPAAVLTAVAKLGFPLFVKPANAGSSVGISKVRTPAEIDAAIRLAFEYDIKILAEAAIVGREIELAVLGGNPPEVSVAGEIVVQHRDGFYSYDAKYLDDQGARLELPAQLSPEQLARSQAMALRTFSVLECDGLARVDLFLQGDGKLLVNEINTLPGFTAVSMYPKLWAHSGITPTILVTRLIELALDRARQRAQLRR
jgi:D-alanine-D-alanine ligase